MMGLRDPPGTQELPNSEANGTWMQALVSRSTKTRPHLSRTGTPEGLAHRALLPDGPTYHLVHGDVLAMVIQPDGHLGCEAELPKGEEERPLVTGLPPAAWPRAPSPRPYLK